MTDRDATLTKTLTDPAVPRVYLDNVIVSGWIRKDLNPAAEMDAVARIFGAVHHA